MVRAVVAGGVGPGEYDKGIRVHMVIAVACELLFLTDLLASAVDVLYFALDELFG